MRILVISNMYPSTMNPTFGVFVKNFYDYLCLKNGADNTWLIAIKGKSESKIGKIGKYVSFYLKVLFCLLFNKYDLVYVHFITFPIVPIKIASFFKDLPLVFNIHGSDWITHTPFAEKLKILALPIVRKAEMVVVPSSIFKKVVLKDLSMLDSSKIKVSYSGGIDLEKFRPLKIINKDKDVLVLGYVSRIIENKGWKLFVDVFKLLIDKGIRVKGIMSGGGKEEQELIQSISYYGLNDVIEYKGAVAQEDLPMLYNQMDLFIFPTLFYESLGLVGLEAMACGVPVVGSNQGGIKEYVKPGVNGFLFESGNVMDLYNKIVNYISMGHDKQIAMKENALETAQTFDKNIVMDDLISEIYKCVS